MEYDINELLKTKKDLYKDFADKLELTDKTDQESKPKIYNYRANIDEDYNNVYTDQVFPVGIEPRFYAKGADDSGNQSISVVDKVTEQVTNKVTENPVNPVSGTSGAPRSQGNYADGTKTMKNYACFDVEQGINVYADLKSKTPYLVKDLEKSKWDKNRYEEIIDICNRMDPTGDKAVFTQWILRKHVLNEEPISGDDSLKYLQDFLDLKKSKKLQNADADINQYKSFADLKEKVDKVLEETGGSVNNKTKKELSEKEGIKLLDSEGDLELYVVNTYEAARKEFEGTGWCVAYPDSYKAYSDTNPNFYYVKKGGKPFYLLHEIDAQGVGNTQPPYEELESTIGLLAKNNLLTMNLGFGLDLLRRQHITKEENPEIYQDIVDSVVGSSIGSAYNLVYWGVITKENDPENYQKIIDACLKDGKYADALLCRHFIDNDSPLFEQAVKKAIELGKGFNLLKSKVITKETTPDLYDEALRAEVDEGTNRHNELDLLRWGFITKDGTPDLFESAIKKSMGSLEGIELVFFDILTPEEFNYYIEKFGIGDAESKEQSEQPTDESTNEGIDKDESAFTLIRKADLIKDIYNREKQISCFEPVNKVAYWEELFGNPFPNAKPSNLEDIGVQLDCNDTTKDTSKDTKKRFTEPSVLPQVYVNTKEQDINKDMTDMENAKFDPHFTNRLPLDFDKEDINKQSDLLGDFNRPWDISESDNILRSRAPITEVNKEEKDKLKEETKKVHKPIKNIPISMNFPYIEDEMGLNKIYYGDMDWISMTDLSQL